MMTKKYRQEMDKFLGMKEGEAKKILTRMMLLKLLQKSNKDLCFRCGQKIIHVDQLCLDHSVPYRQTETFEEAEQIYWNLDQIFPSHKYCNSACTSKTNKNKYIGVDRSRYVCKDGTFIYSAIISLASCKKSFGCYKTPELAAIARDIAIFKEKGGYCKLNFENLREFYNSLDLININIQEYVHGNGKEIISKI